MQKVEQFGCGLQSTFEGFHYFATCDDVNNISNSFWSNTCSGWIVLKHSASFIFQFFLITCNN